MPLESWLMPAKKRAKLYLAVNRYTYTEPILDDGSGPTTDEAHVLVIRATSKRRAQVLAIRAWRRAVRQKRIGWRERPTFIDDASLNPFREVQVEPYGMEAPE